MSTGEKNLESMIEENEAHQSQENEEVKEVIEDVQESIEETVDELEALKEDVAKEKDKFLRLFAEFENYKKRTSKERIELFKTANQEVLKSLLPVLDDFDRAQKEIQKSKDKELTKGVELIYNKLRSTLENQGLTEVEVQTGDTFNADVHEAVTQIPAPEAKLKGKIVDVIEKGYQLGDKIIRFPKVVTGK